MAKRRIINTKFWSDNYVANLDPSEKLLFLYFLTNPYTNITGAYEISIKQIALDTGFDKEMVEKILKRFESDDKVHYLHGYIVVKNFIKHQEKNPKVEIGIVNEAKNLPEDIKKIVYDSLSYLNLNSNLNLNLNLNTLAAKNAAKGKKEKKKEEKIFSFQEELEKLRESERKDHKIIALYWKTKGWTFENQKQLNAALKRELRPAKDLSGYNGEQIARAMKYCAKYEVWTLETVFKRINDVLNGN